MAHDWHREHMRQRTLGQRAADGVARAVGSWTFIIAQTVIVILWVAMNAFVYVRHWDPYPFILLNLLFSVQAAYTAPVIMMSQNRQAERDRAQATSDYSTNVKAEAEIEQIQESLTRISAEDLPSIRRLLERLAGSA